MKRTSDRLATFINKKLTQAATAFEPSARERSPSSDAPPQQGTPLYATAPELPATYNATTAPAPTTHPAPCAPSPPHAAPHTPSTAPPPAALARTTPPHPATPVHPPPPPAPVTNASLDSPYPPKPRSHHPTPHTPHTPVAHTPVTHASPGAPFATPSPYVLPVSTRPAATPSSASSASSDVRTPIPPPPPVNSYHSPYYTGKSVSLPESCVTPVPTPAHARSYDTLPTPLSAPFTTPTSASTPPKPSVLPANASPLPPNLHELTVRRTRAAAEAFPHINLPLSRPLDPTNEADLELWHHQLTTDLPSAIHSTPTVTLPRDPTFCLSFTPDESAPFTPAQWGGLKLILAILARTYKSVRLVLPAPPDTRLLPAAMYPVLSLGTFDAGTHRSRESAASAWAFLEEVGGAWGGGVLYARECRGGSVAGDRDVVRYLCRRTLPVMETMRQVLRNVYFGAVDAHVEKEVAEIAKWAFRKGVCIGPSWREHALHGVGGGLLPGRGVWLDASRTVEGDWRGGVGDVPVGRCVRVVTERGAYYMVRFGDFGNGLWVLVGDVGRRVWSKVMSGACVTALEKGDGLEAGGVETALAGQVGRLNVVSVTECDVRKLG